jgi:Glycerol dehydrogenase and related enzymes
MDFTKAKDVCLPRDLIIGHGVLSRTADVCSNFGLGKDVMIITGHDTYEAAGKEVEEILTEKKFNVNVLQIGDATTDNVEKAIRASKESHSKMLLSVGGGSKIDIGKMVSMKLSVPMVSVPTSASHDGIASGRASLKADDGPVSIDAAVPMAVVADTKVLVRSPYRLLAAGCADVMSNITALMDWDFARRIRNEEFSSSAYSLSKYSADAIIENSKLIRPGMEESIWVSIKPIIVSGLSMSIAGSSRPTSGAEHMFSHALDIDHPGKALHGEQCGVGAIMMMYLHGGDWQVIRNTLKNIGAPTTAKELGLKDDDIINAMTKAHKVRNRFTILGDNGLSRDAAETVARETQVI